MICCNDKLLSKGDAAGTKTSRNESTGFPVAAGVTPLARKKKVNRMPAPINTARTISMSVTIATSILYFFKSIILSPRIVLHCNASYHITCNRLSVALQSNSKRQKKNVV